MSFFAELKRRKVIRVGIAYAIGAWLLLQLTEVLTELLSLPSTVGPVVVGIVAVGFPVVIVLAWVFELTSDGLKRDTGLRPGERSSGKVINITVLVLLAVALVYFVWESRFQMPQEATTDRQTVVAVGANGSGLEVTQIGRSIAVLPFENFSGNPEDEYFADGLTDTLLHKLAQINELKVIARNSTFQFKGTNKDVREVGEILGVETVLEGSVQRAGNQVRIIAQLIRTSDGAHVWSQSFDDSMDNIFDLQDRITAEIVDAFEFSLTAAERQRLLRDGTDSPEAYDLVIRALNTPENFDEWLKGTPEDDPRIQYLKRAIELDPDYAQAWAHLSKVYDSWGFWTDNQEEFAAVSVASLANAEEALRLDDTLALAHNARGWVAHRQREPLEASRYFRRALEIEPNNLSAMSGLALQLLRRDEPQEALTLLNRSHELDPTSTSVFRQKFFAYSRLGQTEQAIEQLKSGIEIDPEAGVLYNDLQRILAGQGKLDESASFTSRLLANNPGSYDGQLSMAEAWVSATDFERAAAWLDLLETNWSDSDLVRSSKIKRFTAAGDFTSALRLLERQIDITENAYRWYSTHFMACLALELMECADQQLGLQMQSNQDDIEKGRRSEWANIFHSVQTLLWSDATGNALDANEQILTLEQVMAETAWGPVYFTRAGLLAMSGKPDEGMDLLELSLSDEGVFNLDLFGLAAEHSLLLNPLRDHERFPAWLVAHQDKRLAMLEIMQEMERRGTIISAATVSRQQ